MIIQAWHANAMHVISGMLDYELHWRLVEMLSTLKLNIQTLSSVRLYLPYTGCLLCHQNQLEASACLSVSHSFSNLSRQLLDLSVRMPGHIEDSPTIAISLAASLPRCNLKECKSILLHIFAVVRFCASCRKSFRHRLWGRSPGAGEN
jgi:hypothetical protein